MVFDGNAFAKGIEQQLKKKVGQLKAKPKLVIFYSGVNRGSEIYMKKKKEMGKRIGIEVSVIECGGDELVNEIEKANKDEAINGIMVQLPVSGLSGDELDEVLDTIDLAKDVDGLNPSNRQALRRGEQSYVPAAVKAVGKVFDEALRNMELDIMSMKVAVVGSRGMVGAGVVAQMRRFTVEPVEFEKDDELHLTEMDVVISCAGQVGLIKAEMVKKGVVAIDVGYPKGDFEPQVQEKAAFFTPVPGGVGPVTVVSLMENVVNSLD